MTATKTSPGRRTRPAAATQPAFQEPLIADKGRPQTHNDIPVVREEILFNIPGAPFKISKLHLADGTVAWACRDCVFTGDKRVDVMHHRNSEHGAKFGKKPVKVIFPGDEHPGDLVLAPRADGPAPTDPLKMTLGEYLSLAPSFAALSDLVDRLENERDELARELSDRASFDQRNRHIIAVHDALEEEVIDLRLKMKSTGSYNALRNEVLELRTWKKKVTAKLKAVGFTLEEE